MRAKNISDLYDKLGIEMLKIWILPINSKEISN